MADDYDRSKGRSTVAEPTNLAVGQLDLTGTYTLMSTAKTAPAHALVRATYTTFGGALRRPPAPSTARPLDGALVKR